MANNGRVGRAGRSGPSRVVLAAAAIGVVLVAGTVAWRWGSDDGLTEPPATSTMAAAPVADTAASDPPTPVESQLPWPGPPADHEPHVLSRPGDGPIVAKPDGLRLLYVNSIGRVTLLDLATGDRTEIEVANDRVHDTIALEADGFRSFTRRMNVELAGPGAVVVHLHRPTLLTGWSAESEPGLHVCLTVGCLASGRLDRLVVEVEPWPAPSVTFEPLRSAARPDLVDLVGGDGDVSGRFRIVETPGGSARIPEPLGGPVWLVRVTDADAASSDV